MKAQGLFSNIIIGFLCLGFLTACPTTQEQITEQVRVGVYATHDSIGVSRYDLAKRYSAETVRMVPPPQRRMVIRALEQIQQEERAKGNRSWVSKIKNKGKKQPSNVPRKSYIVLPEGSDASMVLVENSPEFLALKSENDGLKSQLETEAKSFSEYRKVNDATLIKQDQELKELRAYKEYHSFWNTIKRWYNRILGWGTIGLIIFAIAAAVSFIWFRPAWSLFAAVLRAASTVIMWIFAVLANLINKIFRKKS